MNQKLEDDLKSLQIETDKLKIEKASFIQQIKILEHDLSKVRNNEDQNASGPLVTHLKREIEELKVTNGVYMEKINELVDQMNQMDEEHCVLLEERNRALMVLKRQNEEMLTKMHESDREVFAKNIPQISSEVQVKRKAPSNSIFNAPGGQDAGDIAILRQENEALKQQLLILKNKNMELQNNFTELKSRNRSKSDVRRR